MPKREQVRVIDWRGELSAAARLEHERYREETRRYWAWDEDHYYVPVAPDEEAHGEP